MGTRHALPGLLPPLTLSPTARERIRSEIDRAGGREVCFLATVSPERTVEDPRAVSRGNREAVLAAARDAEPGGIMVHNHPSGLLEPSDADLAVAARLYEAGLGTAITDNDGASLYVVVEPPAPRFLQPLDVGELDGVLAPGGALARVLPGFEDRDGQRQMLRIVTARFNDGGIAVVEAGTGIGKSLAYLIPAASWAARNGERTVVSTGTINLQEQLVGKDLPLVRRLLDRDFRWSLVKGRGNYVSIRRARLAAETAGSLFDADRSDELRALLEWIDSTDDGSLSDFSTPPSDDVWEEVRSDADICLRAKCPHFQACFYQRARRDAASADILVVNHHLLFSDLSVRLASGNFTQSAVLPAYKRLVLDEAHNVEDAATSHLGAEVSRQALFRLMSRLERNGKGVLAALYEKLRGREGDPAREDLMERIDGRVRPALEGARARLGSLFDALDPLAPPAPGEALRLGGPEGPEPVDRVDVRERHEGLLHAIRRLEREMAELRSRIELGSAPDDPPDPRLLDLVSAERRLDSAARTLSLVLDPKEDRSAYVRWLEERGYGRRGTRGRNLVLAAAPVEPGPLLRESLFEPMATTILTSATLTTRSNFAFVRSRLGLGAEEPPMVVGSDEDLYGDGASEPPFGGASAGARGGAASVVEGDLEVTEAIVPSPFAFGSQSLLAVPTDLPDLRVAADDFRRETTRVVLDMANLTGGGLFVLFTSHRSLRSVAERLRATPEGARWPLFVHGERPRARLLAEFVQAGNGILLGTASFWEGVDVPGEPLRGLILEKLPFKVPTEPITAARVEALAASGRNAFWDYVLPHAALRLKQGFGRLIRSRGDRGAVVLLDDRIVTRRYGRYLRESLPDAPLVKGPWREVERALRAFYGVA